MRWEAEGPYEVWQASVFLTERHCRASGSPSDQGSGRSRRMDGMRERPRMAGWLSGWRSGWGYELMDVVRGSSGGGSVPACAKVGGRCTRVAGSTRESPGC